MQTKKNIGLEVEMLLEKWEYRTAPQNIDNLDVHKLEYNLSEGLEILEQLNVFEEKKLYYSEHYNQALANQSIGWINKYKDLLQKTVNLLACAHNPSGRTKYFMHNTRRAIIQTHSDLEINNAQTYGRYEEKQWAITAKDKMEIDDNRHLYKRTAHKIIRKIIESEDLITLRGLQDYLRFIYKEQDIAMTDLGLPASLVKKREPSKKVKELREKVQELTKQAREEANDAKKQILVKMSQDALKAYKQEKKREQEPEADWDKQIKDIRRQILQELEMNLRNSL